MNLTSSCLSFSVKVLATHNAPFVYPTGFAPDGCAKGSSFTNPHCSMHFCQYSLSLDGCKHSVKLSDHTCDLRKMCQLSASTNDIIDDFSINVGFMLQRKRIFHCQMEN